MEQGLNLALQFIRDVPTYKFPAEYYEPDEEPGDEADVPITNKDNFMIDLHRRRLMPNTEY
jgi:hypothetical protein